MMADELQDRTCRCCGRSYQYPVLKSQATRFYCQACTELGDNVRAMFEHFNKRIKKLSKDLVRLQKRMPEDDGKA